MKKVLIIRFSSIGDIVLTSPVIRCISEQRSDIEIHYLTKDNFKALLSADSRIKKVWTLGDSTPALIKELKQENFDYIIDLHHNLRTLRFKRALGKPFSSFHKLNFRKYLLVQFKVNRLPKLHIVDRYIETCKELGVVNDGKGLDFQLEPSQNPAEVISKLEPNFIAIAVGAQHATKKLPAAKMLEMIHKINSPIVLLGGGKDDEAMASFIMDNYKGDFLLHNLVNKLSIQGSAWVVNASSCLISHDTGLMHIGAALKKRVISIWGNTVPEFGMFPYYGDLAIEQFQSQVTILNCRPCSKIGHHQCPKKHFNCMNMQDIDAIARQVLSWKA